MQCVDQEHSDPIGHSENTNHFFLDRGTPSSASKETGKLTVKILNYSRITREEGIIDRYLDIRRDSSIMKRHPFSRVGLVEVFRSFFMLQEKLKHFQVSIVYSQM